MNTIRSAGSHSHSQLLQTAFVVPMILLVAMAHAADVYPGREWEKAPSSLLRGWSPEGLAKVEALWKSVRTDSLSIMIVEDGYVIREWGETRRPVACYSMRKSFLSALFGIYVGRGDIRLSSTLEQVGIDDIEPRLSKQEKQATVRNLLMCKSGVYHPAAYETKGMVKTRPVRGSHPPGTFWWYNNWDFNALGTIFTKQTGKGIYDAFYHDIVLPLEMQDVSKQSGKFVYDKSKSMHPAYTFEISTRDRARFGLLFLRQGRWETRQIIPRSWVRNSTTAQERFNERSGYGYMWWVTMPPGRPSREKAEGRIFSAKGRLGQFITVIPSMKLVLAMSFDADGSAKLSDDASVTELGKLIIGARRK